MGNALWHNSKTGLIHVAMLVFFMGACAQSRSGVGQQEEEKRFQPQEVCDNIDGEELLGCFEVTLNITRNEANIAVLALDIDPLYAPYRVMARRSDSNEFSVLEENVRVEQGGLFIVKPRAGHPIEKYTEWRFESSLRLADNQSEFVSAPAGTGIPLAQVQIYFPELEVLNAVK